MIPMFDCAQAAKQTDTEPPQPAEKFSRKVGAVETTSSKCYASCTPGRHSIPGSMLLDDVFHA